MTPTEAATRLVGALEGAGLRVATRHGEFTPPVVYVQLWGGSDVALLAGGARTTFALYWCPVRGLDDLYADTDAVGAILEAVGPITAEPVEFSSSSLTVGETSWTAWRAEAVLY